MDLESELAEPSRSRPRTEWSFDDLYIEKRPSLVRLAFVMLGDRQLAEEVVQEAFIRLHQRWASVEFPATYVHQIVVNLSKNQIGRLILERKTAENQAARLPKDADDTNDEYLWDALLALPHRYRVVLVLRYYEDLSVAEIADLIDARPGTVKSLIHRGLEKLKEAVQ